MYPIRDDLDIKSYKNSLYFFLKKRIIEKKLPSYVINYSLIAWRNPKQ